MIPYTISAMMGTRMKKQGKMSPKTRVGRYQESIRCMQKWAFCIQLLSKRPTCMQIMAFCIRIHLNMDVFHLQETDFFVEAAGISSETATCAKNPVAGDDQGDGIMSHGSADSLGGHPSKPHPGGNACGNLAVGHGFTERDGQQNLPHCLAERSAPQAEFRTKSRVPAAEIDASARRTKVRSAPRRRSPM